MKACILTIGNEILKGKTVNTNAAEIGRMLSFSGYDVIRGLVVPDVKEEIGQAFRSLIVKCDIVVSSGGLGPTFDDITMASFAEEFNIPMVVNAGIYEVIKTRTIRRGLEMTKEREKMALVPQGSIIIKNEVGTAPGIEYKIESARIFILPGVPAEMRSMLKSIEDKIKLNDSFYYEDSIVIVGVYEASLAPFITELMKRYGGRVYIKSHPTIKEGNESSLEVEVSVKSDSIKTSKKLVNDVLKEIKNLELKIKKRVLTNSS
ncbi:MAG: molybdopterin-binding protein [Candidatus Thermoplasmatota archaeon]|nr:molybdopterin-binding protein [Candidatus Thermoplasmatota archaeon]